MTCQKEINAERCPCSYEPCERKGACCACLSYHLEKRELPGCCFSDAEEKTWNRSFDHFSQLVSKGKM